MSYKVIETAVSKILESPDAHFVFSKSTGVMISWGKTPEEDVERFPAPTILDMEITTICRKGKCPFCYKSNTAIGRNMSFSTFKQILDVFPSTLTQLAFGADADLTSNPDLWKMMDYAKSKGIIPNITAAWCDENVADKLAKYCGAVAFSRYEHTKDKCYDSVKMLTDRKMKQVNMHFMLAEETYKQCLNTLDDIHKDPRLKKLNALVILSLKKKGRGESFHPCTQEHFNEIVKKAKELDINLGFDSCSSTKALKAFNYDKKIEKCVISCESTIESSYINVDGQYFPCSFMEGTPGWEEGLDVLECKNESDFVKKIWNNPKTLDFMNKLKSTTDKHDCRHCPYYEV